MYRRIAEKPLWSRARPNSPAYHSGGSGNSHHAATVIATPIRPILVQPSKIKDNNGGSSFPKASYPPAPAIGKTRHGNHGRVDHCRKPSCSYNCLIGLALKSSKTGNLPVNEIYAFIQQEFPYFRTATESWKNCIRHSLSLGQYFRKVERGNGWLGRKGFHWEVIPQKRAALEREIKKFPAKEKNYPPTETGAINATHQGEGTAGRTQVASKPITTQSTTQTQLQPIQCHWPFQFQPSTFYFPATSNTITPSMIQPQALMAPPCPPAMASASAVNHTQSQTQQQTLQKSVQPQPHSASYSTLPQELLHSTAFPSSCSPAVTPSTEQDLTQPQTFPPFPHELSVTASDLLDVIPLLQMDGDQSPFPSIELSTNPDMPSEALDVPLNTTTPHVHNPYELAFNPGYITSSQPTLYSTTLDSTTSTTNTQPPQPFPQQPSSYPSFVALGSDNSESLLNEMLSTPAQPMVWPPSLPSLQQTATLQQVPPILGAHALPTGDFLTNSTLPLDTDKFQPSFEGHQTDQGVHLPSPRSTFSPPPYIPLEASPKLQDNGSGETSANSTQSSTPLETPTTQCSISKGQLQCSDQAMLEQHLEVYLEDILDGCDDSFSDIDSYDVDVGYDELFSDLESFWVNFPKSPLQKLESDTKKDPAKELLKELDMDPDTTLEEFADSLLAKSSYSHSSKSSCPRPSTPVASMANETTSTPSTSDVQVVSTPDPQVNEDAKHSSVENRDLGSGSSDEISSVESALSLVGRAENSREWRALDIDDLVELIQSAGNKNSTPTAAKPEMTKESRKRSAEEAFGDAQPMGTKKAKKEAEDSFSISNGNITCYGMAANFSSDPHTAPPHLEGKNSEGNEESALPQCLTMNDDLLAALHLQAIDIQFFSLFSTEDIEQLQTTSN